MKNIILNILVCASLLISCKNRSKKNEEHADGLQSVSCYIYLSHEDTVSMTLHFLGDEVTGNLNYTIFEKDINKGALSGHMKGDTLFATYRFMSEGENSERQVVFLKKENKWIEGSGEIDPKTGISTFENKKSIVFDGFVLTQMECPN